MGRDLRKNSSIFDESLRQQWSIFVSACTLMSFAVTPEIKREKMIAAQVHFDELRPFLSQYGISSVKLDELDDALRAVSSPENLTHEECAVGSDTLTRK